MTTTTSRQLAKELAKQQGISTARASLLLSLACAELEITETVFHPHTTAELERIVAQKVAKDAGTDRRIKRPAK